MNINLLPWREWERTRRNRAFWMQMGTTAVAAVTLVLASGSQISASTERQLARNAVIGQALTVLEGEVATAAALLGERDVLLAEGDAIERMHGTRFLAVGTFSELAATMPARVRYTSLTLTDGLLEATGASESNDGVSALMRNLDSSPWFEHLALKGIEEDGEGGSVTFSLGFERVQDVAERPPGVQLADGEATE